MMWKGSPREVKYSGSTAVGKPGCFWSRLTARRSKATGALLFNDRSTSRSV